MIHNVRQLYCNPQCHSNSLMSIHFQTVKELLTGNTMIGIITAASMFMVFLASSKKTALNSNIMNIYSHTIYTDILKTRMYHHYLHT